MLDRKLTRFSMDNLNYAKNGILRQAHMLRKRDHGGFFDRECREFEAIHDELCDLCRRYEDAIRSADPETLAWLQQQ